MDVNRIMEKLVKETKKTLTDAEKQFMLKEYKDKLMSKCPLKFILERDDYEENKESLRISSVELLHRNCCYRLSQKSNRLQSCPCR